MRYHIFSDALFDWDYYGEADSEIVSVSINIPHNLNIEVWNPH